MSKKLSAAVLMAMACAFGPLTAGAQDDEGAEKNENLIEVTGTAQTSTHACTPATEVEIAGASNTVTLTGECKSVTVSGSSNKVKVEAVKSITVEGSDNAITWKRGHGKAKPKVSRSGVNNKVSQEK
ncbi:DUF3060 domain-containing protein [Pyxidicoccus sp. 3LFB2]